MSELEDHEKLNVGGGMGVVAAGSGNPNVGLQFKENMYKACTQTNKQMQITSIYFIYVTLLS